MAAQAFVAVQASLVTRAGSSPNRVQGLLAAVASPVEHRLLGEWASAAVAGGLSSWGSHATEHELSSCAWDLDC